MSVKTADSKIVVVDKVYYAVVGCSIKRVRCRSVGQLTATFSEVGRVYEKYRMNGTDFEYFLPNIYRSFKKAQEFLIDRINAKLELAKAEARRIPSLKGQITRIKALA